MNKKFSHFYLFCLIIIFFSLAACSTSPKITVEAKFLGEEIRTTTDSSLVKYYLESYLQGKNSAPDLHKKIDKLYAQYNDVIPTSEDLKNISEEYSIDFSALFLAHNLQKIERNRKIQNDFNHFLNNINSTSLALKNDSNQYMVLFVPGWNYVENGHLTGSDFAIPRQLVSDLNIENYLVKVPSNGSVTDVANHLFNKISQYSRYPKDIIIVGASSAGPAIHLVLADKLKVDHQSNIKAWLNIGGILRGSPIIDYYQQWPQSLIFNIIVWLKDWNKEKIYSMSAKISRKRFAMLGDINNNLVVINYMGLSLSGQLSKYSRDNYSLLTPEGPNDGLTPIADIIAPNSSTIVAIGSDHFFAEDPRINEKTIALLKVVISQIENKK